MQRGKTPYRKLGLRLSEIRKSVHESIHEVSGAVELDSDILMSFERGEARPSADVLELLISHFGIKDEEAEELWEMAGYNSGSPKIEDMSQLPTLVVVPTDNRVIYTDTVNVSINNYGVVMNFMQNAVGGQPVAISRVGMSLEHAKSVLEVLTKTIAQAEANSRPKQLPDGSKTKKTK